MGFEAGHTKKGGRKKGTANRVTTSMREAWMEAFTQIGGVDALVAWGKQPKNQTAFFSLASKLIPQEISGELKTSGTLTIVRRQLKSRADLKDVRP